MTSSEHIANTLNTSISLLVVTYEGVMLFALPPMMSHSLAWGWLLLPFIWVTLVHWALIHEAIHKHLHSDPTANEYAGRLLSISMGAAFSVLRFGHLMHHRLNRSLNSEYVTAPTPKARLRYYWNLFAGVYAMEVATTLLLAILPNRLTRQLAHSYFFPGHADAAEAGNRFFFLRDNITNLRIDAVGIIMLYGTAFSMAGTHWPVVLAVLAVRAFAISFTDNLYHYATPADNSRAGKALSLPPGIARALLNSNYHEAHHQNPAIPWHRLPNGSHRCDGSYLAHALMQLQGPLVTPN